MTVTRAINEALVSAQQLRAEVREAGGSAKRTHLARSAGKSERMLAEQRQAISRIEADLEVMIRQRRYVPRAVPRQ